MGTAIYTTPGGRRVKLTYESREQLDSMVNDLASEEKAQNEFEKARAFSSPGQMMGSAAEFGASGLTGLAGLVAGAGRSIYGMATGEPWKETAEAASDKAASLTYSPRSVGGQGALNVLAYPSQKLQEGGNALQDVIGYDTPARERLGALANIGTQVTGQALMTLLPMKGRVTGPLEKVRVPRQMKPIGGFESIDKRLAAFSKNAAQRQATRLIRSRVGEVGTRSQALLSDAVANPAEFVTKVGSDSAPTVGEVVAHLPEGAPLIALQEALAQLDRGRPELVSARFGRRWANRETAIKEAIATRDKITAPLREKAFADVEQARSVIARVKDRFKSKADALQTKGRVQTIESMSKARRDQYVPVPGMPRAPGKYTPYQGRIEEAAAALPEIDDIIATRQRELSAAQTELSNLRAKGMDKTINAQEILSTIDSINQTPGPRVYRAVQLTLRRVYRDLKKWTRDDGTIAPDDLSNIRNQIGVHINKALGKKPGEKLSSVDQRLTAGIERTIQKSFDESMPPSWKDYLETYAEHSDLIEAEKARFKGMRNPLQRSAVDATEHQSLTPTTGLPVNLLSKEASAVSAAMRYMGKKGSADVATFLADMLFDTRKAAEAIKAMPATERNALLTTISKRYGPRAALSLTLTNQQTDQQNVNPSR
jgi:hypothetical protein